MISIITTIIAFILSGVIGNKLVQKWQHRNWLSQQLHLGQQEELREIKSLLDEMSNTANSRLYSMKRVAGHINSPLTNLESIFSEYAEQVKVWNIALPRFYNKISLLFSFDKTQNLEHNVQPLFVSAGQKLELALKLRRRSDIVPMPLIRSLNNEISSLNAYLRDFLLEINNLVLDRKKIVAEGRKIYYRDGILDKYSTFDLLKALFARDIDRIYIISSS